MALDADGAYLDPTRYASLKNPALAGVGLDLTVRERALTVVAPLDGGPGARAGIRAGDRILKVDGVSTERMKLLDAVDLLSGRPGSTTQLTVARPEWGQPRELSVAREAIRARSVESKVIPPSVGYIRVRRLQDTTPPEVQNALDTLRAAGAKGLVLDLRVNSGGPVAAAIGVAELFLPAGRLIAYTEGRTKQQTVRFPAHAKRPITDVPLVVLVDEGTAAGAEIVAAALQEWQRARLLGSTTQGQASIQSLIPLSNGGGLRLTTARWFTAAGRSVDRRGLTPDVEVARRPEEDRLLWNPAQDPQLRRALDLVGPRTR
jgi:carboxyl-terminal processing protease